MFSLRSRPLDCIESNVFKGKGYMHETPKAEVTGSNPVGCAKPFKDIDAVSTEGLLSLSGVCPDNRFMPRSGTPLICRFSVSPDMLVVAIAYGSRVLA